MHLSDTPVRRRLHGTVELMNAGGLMIGFRRQLVVGDRIGAKKGGAEDSPGMGQAVWRENSLLKLYARHTSPQSPLTFSKPRSRVCL